MKWLALAVLVPLAVMGCRTECEGRSQCDCFAARDVCKLETEPCWCPSVCDQKIDCICGGGKFLRCTTR